MWHAALSLIVSTWATKRVAEIERNRFLAVDTVGMNRGQDGSPVPDSIAQAVIATMREARQPAAACANAPRWSASVMGLRCLCFT
jgi:4-hydroxy-3-methylbut-2-enyl diphosphate reductase IspH